MTTGWAMVAALASMVLYALASVSQAAASKRSTGAKVMLHPLYLLGLGADGAAWAASLLAMTRLPLFVVQPVLAGSVAVAVLLAVPLLGARLVRADVGGIALTTVGLVLVSASASEESTAAAPHGFSAGILVLLAVAAALTGVLYRRGGAAPLALVCGLAFAGAALAARALLEGLGGVDLATVGTLLRDPLAWSVAGFGALGSLGYARALERGGLGIATALMWVVEALVPGAVGVAVLGDAVRPGWALAAAAGVVAAVAGCVVLALSPTQAVLDES